jgi:hypothetical protein
VTEVILHYKSNGEEVVVNSDHIVYAAPKSDSQGGGTELGLAPDGSKAMTVRETPRTYFERLASTRRLQAAGLRAVPDPEPVVEDGAGGTVGG